MVPTIRIAEAAPRFATAGPYDVTFAFGADSRRQEYALRHAAFVEEHQWLAAAADGLEIDEFDQFSCSALLTDSETGRAAACQRLILPERLPAGFITNVQRLHRRGENTLVDFAALPRATWAEASRLTIAPERRWGSARQHRVPAMVAISYATLALAIAFDRTLLFSVSDPRTARLSQRLGVRMHRVGEDSEFHGRRATFRIDIAAVRASLPAEWQPIVERLALNAREVAQRSAVGASSNAA